MITPRKIFSIKETGIIIHFSKRSNLNVHYRLVVSTSFFTGRTKIAQKIFTLETKSSLNNICIKLLVLHT